MSLLRAPILITALFAISVFSIPKATLPQTGVVVASTVPPNTLVGIQRLPGGGEIHLKGIFKGIFGADQTGTWDIVGAPVRDTLSFVVSDPGLSWEPSRHIQRTFVLIPNNVPPDYGFTVNFSNDVRKAGLAADHQISMSAIFPKDLRTTTVSVGIAQAPWKTIKSISIRPGLLMNKNLVYECKLSSAFHQTADGSTMTSWIFGQGAHKSRMSAQFNMTTSDYRIAAMDIHGKTIGGLIYRRPPYSSQFQEWMVFETPFETSRLKFRKICIQTRPYEWVEFRNVPLYPASESQAASGSAPQ